MLSAWCDRVGAWYSVSVLLTATLLVCSAWAEQEPPGAPRCTHPRCKYIGHNITYVTKHNYHYEVEGNTITITNSNSRPHSIQIHCDGSVLESPALPRAAPAQLVYDVELKRCPLPATGSLGDSFATLNLTFCQHATEKPCELAIRDLQDGPRPAGRHFVGLERLHTLVISITFLTRKYTRVTAERNFLMALTNLRELRISESVTLPVDLDALPPSLEDIYLENSERLPEAIYSSVTLRKLSFSRSISLDAVAVAPGLRELALRSSASTLRLDAAPALETLLIKAWTEPMPPPISSCDKLREICLEEPAMHALPHGWLTNCSHLEELIIMRAYNLTTLPPTLFSSNNRLKLLKIVESALETLSEGVLDDMRSLEELNLSHNHIKVLPKNLFKAFLYYPLSNVDLSSNDLNGSVLDAVELLPQYKLTELYLSYNPRIGDFCDVTGYSPLRWFVNLRKLHLRNTGATRICTDWREDMLELRLLDLKTSNISELAYEDLQFTRRVQAEVVLRGARVAAVRITREDYNKATQASPSFTSVDTDAELQCDCNLYWARRALEHPVAQHTLPGLRSLRCVGGGLLRDVAAEELECGAREECAAAALPAECACAARPDDDPTQERWFVRVRCGNSSMGFVPRRIHPFYPLYQSYNQGAYVTQFIASMN